MKLYESIGPNPRVVKMFIAEKGLQIPRQQVNLMAGENRQDAYKALNPSGTTPALETDEGVILAEITTICEYLEELHPNPPLIGETPMQRAETRMWVRRIDLGILEPMTNGFRYSQGLQMFQDRMRCIPQAAEDLKTCAREKLEWLDDKIAGRQWIAGDRFTLADIVLYAFLDFGAQVGQPLDAKNKNLTAWLERVKARDSVTASA
ncbi:MAG TPA: glutathione S-transferase family protein [Caulobacteraceae bacterium]|jgi:glutathione S-transferase|nr:glutathione S-transferase family protein [Caulobacteraceae bacterium]